MQTPAAPLNLSRIYQGCVFHSNERVASHDHVSSALAEHDLHWRRGAVDAALYQARINRLQLFVLRYGAQVEVRPRLFDDFALVHMSLKGCTEFDADGQRVCVPQGRTAIIAPRKSLSMAWGEGSEQLIVKVPHALLGIGGAGLATGLLSEALTPQWDLMLQSLLGVLALPHSVNNAAWIDHLERSVAMFLMARDSTADAAPLPPSASASAAAEVGQGLGDACNARRLDALERYMRAKLCAPVALCDLAAAASVSARTLTMLCQRHHGVSPMGLLRNMRLDAAHAALQTQVDLSVTDAAVAFGFGNLGRFSAYYRERFGQLPKHTYASAGRCSGQALN